MDELTTLILCKNVPLNNSYELSIDFDNAAAQKAFFATYKAEEIGECNTSYLRINRAIEVPYHFDEMVGINYLYYNNPGDNKTYYYFVTSKQYINPNNTRLEIELDVFQTYMFNYELGECFVSREHQDRYSRDGNTYKPIVNLEQENIEVGANMEQVQSYSANSDKYNGLLKWAYIYTTSSKVTIDGGEVTFNVANSWVDGVDQNYYCVIVPLISNVFGDNIDINLYLTLDNGEKTLIDTCGGEQDDAGKNTVAGIKATKILNAFQKLDSTYKIVISSIAPPYADISSYIDGNELAVDINFDTTSKFYDLLIWPIITAPNIILFFSRNQWTNFALQEPVWSIENPINEQPINLAVGQTKNIANEPKLKTSQFTRYNLLYGDYNLEIAPERCIKNGFADIDVVYSRSCSPTAGEIFAVLNYDGNLPGYNGQLICVNNNVIPQSTSAWANYERNHSTSLTTGLLTSVITGTTKAAASYALGGPAAAAASAVNSAMAIGDELNRRQDIKNTPDTPKTAGNDFGILSFNYGINPVIQKMEVKPQFMNRAFNYMYRYGYAVNNFLEPNLRSRYYFNYIRVIMSEFKSSSIDSDYVSDLIRIFNRGITIWHCRDVNTFKNTFLDYSKENVEMSLL